MTFSLHIISRIVTLVKRNLDKSSDNSPMSDSLVARMEKVLNAEISGIIFIPLFASLMARGVLYANDFPWQAGLALTILATVGASFLYGKQSLTWSDDNKMPTTPVELENK